MKRQTFNHLSSRRKFLKLTGFGAVALGLQQIGCRGGGKPSSPPIQGFEEAPEN